MTRIALQFGLPSKLTREGEPVSLWSGQRRIRRTVNRLLQPNQIRIYHSTAIRPVFEYRLFLHFKELLHTLLITTWYMIGCASRHRLVRGHLLDPKRAPACSPARFIGLLIGVPCQAAAVVFVCREQPILSYLFSQLPPAVVIALLVVLLWIAQTGWFTALPRSPVQAVGQMALSNYVLEGNERLCYFTATVSVCLK